MFELDKLDLGQLVFIDLLSGKYDIGIIVSQIFQSDITKLNNKIKRYCTVLSSLGILHILVENLHPIPHI